MERDGIMVKYEHLTTEIEKLLWEINYNLQRLVKVLEKVLEDKLENK